MPWDRLIHLALFVMGKIDSDFEHFRVRMNWNKLNLKYETPLYFFFCIIKYNISMYNEDSKHVLPQYF